MTENKRYKTLFFDLDRTLWDFDANSVASLKILYEKYKLAQYAPRFEKFVKVYEKENSRLWAMYQKSEVTKDEVGVFRFSRTLKHFDAPQQGATEMAKQYLDTLAEQTLIFPNTLEVLQELSNSYSLVIITNGFKEVQEKKMKKSGLSTFFTHIITSEDAGALKPRPEIFELALKTADATPESSLMIGDDHKADILGAKRSRIDQVWFQPNKEIRGDATYIIKDLKELLTKVHL